MEEYKNERLCDNSKQYRRSTKRMAGRKECSCHSDVYKRQMVLRWAKEDELKVPIRVGAFRCEESSNFGCCTIGSGLKMCIRDSLRGLLCTKIYMVILSNKTYVYNCQEDKKTIEILSFLTKIVFFLYIIFLIYKKN